jgi:hypothetical protein
MISAKSGVNNSIKKKDVLSQKVGASGFVPLSFAHKATNGDTGLNLTTLTAPTVEMPTFTNPNLSQLTGANLLFFKQNLILTSSLRGILQQDHSYTVASNTQINFLGFTAAQGEIFTGTIFNSQITGARVVGADISPITGILAANSTDFNVGTPFTTNKYPSQQLGAVLVFLNGVIQFRNTGNSSTNLDGNYYEVDAGGGYSSVVRFNSSAPVSRSVMVVYLGNTAERPDGSMMAQIESAQGQVNKLIEVVSDVSGLPESTFRVAPTNQDLKTFGDQVLRKAYYDVSNTWTAAQPLIGVVDGSAASAGQIGEFLTASGAGGINNNTNVANVASIALTAGDWDVWGFVEDTCTGSSGTSVVFWAGCVSTTSLSIDAPSRQSFYGAGYFGVSSSIRSDVPVRRISVATTTTVYLVSQTSVITAGGISAITATSNCTIYARRKR